MQRDQLKISRQGQKPGFSMAVWMAATIPGRMALIDYADTNVTAPNAPSRLRKDPFNPCIPSYVTVKYEGTYTSPFSA